MMSGKLSLEWCRRHSGHSSKSGPVPLPALEEEEMEDDGPEAAEQEAAAIVTPSDDAATPQAAEKEAGVLSLHISEWMLSMLAMPSTPPSPEC